MYSSCRRSLSIKLTAMNGIWMKIFLLLFCWLSMQSHTSHRNEVVYFLDLLRLAVSTGCITGCSVEYCVFVFYYVHICLQPGIWEWFVKSELNL